MPQFVQAHILGESGDAEAGIVHQHVDAAVIADDLLDGVGQSVKMSHIELSKI